VKLSRRHFLIGSGALLVALGGFVGSRAMGSETVIRRILQKHLPGIRIPRSEVHRYRTEMEQFASDRMRTMLSLVSTFGVAYPLLSLPVLRGVRDRFEQRLVVHFLLSTNFFRESAVRDGSADVRYVGHHTQRIACSNPFAVLN
jgi:hypothetical protein